MARIRNIKPDFFTDDELAELPMGDRLLFAGLWTEADREGRLQDRPKTIKARILPFDDHDVDAAMDRLQAIGKIRRYVVEGVRYIWIPGFKRHQYISNRETESLIPPCSDESETTLNALQTGCCAQSHTSPRPVLDQSHTSPRPVSTHAHVGDSDKTGDMDNIGDNGGDNAREAASRSTHPPNGQAKPEAGRSHPASRAKPKALTPALLEWGRENCPRLDREDLEREYRLMPGDWAPPSSPNATGADKLQRWWTLKDAWAKEKGAALVSAGQWDNIATPADLDAHERREYETALSEWEDRAGQYTRNEVAPPPRLPPFERWVALRNGTPETEAERVANATWMALSERQIAAVQRRKKELVNA